MPSDTISEILTSNTLKKLFPDNRAALFFDALFGDSAEGAYDINLVFKGQRGNRIEFEFHLKQRPGKCLSCSLTYGLPEVFTRHPIINIKGLVQEIGQLFKGQVKITKWELGSTREVSSKLHVIPFVVFIEN